MVSRTSGDVDINVAGFVTPPSGTVETRIGAMTMEGDLGFTGDRMRLNNRILSDAAHPRNNFFNSAVARDGVRVTDKFPDYVNQLGLDLFTLATTDLLPNSATSAEIRLSTRGETYFPQVVTFATNIFAPQITLDKTVTDLNGGRVEPGDLLSYEVTVANGAFGGSDTAVDLVLRDPIPDNTSYEPNTLEIVSGANAGPKSDPVGDDEGAVSGNTVFFRLGTGASGFSGGSLAPGETTSIRFQVRVDAGVANQVQISNAAELSFTAQTQGTDLTAVSNAAAVITARPILELTKTALPASAQAGGIVAWRLDYLNRGGVEARNVTLADTLPGDASFVSATAGGSHSAGTVTWALGTIGPGASGSVVVTAQVASPIADGTVLSNNALLSADNAAAVNASASISVTSTPVLTLEKVDVGDPVNAGENIVYQLNFENTGSDVAFNAVLTDAVPANSSFVSATGGGVLSGTTVTWNLGNIAPGDFGQVTLTLRADNPLPDGTVVENSATLGANNAASVGATEQTTITSAPELALDKAATPNPVAAGDVLTYSLAFSNNGSDVAVGASLVDQLPAEVDFVSASGGGSWDPVSRTISWNLGDIPAGTSGQVSANVRVESPLPDGFILTNEATLSAGGAEPVASTDTVVTSAPVLSLTKDVSQRVVDAGQELVYTLSFENTGNADATNVVITDSPPDNTTLVSVTSEAVYNFGTQSWAIGTIPAGSGGSVAVTVRVDSPLADGTRLLNAATLTSAETPPQSATAVTTVRSAPVLTIAKRALPEQVEAGQALTYVIDFANTGNANASNVVIRDPVPANTTLLTADAGGVLVSDVVTWSIGALAAGASGSVSWTAEVDAPLPDGTVISNSADLSSDEVPTVSTTIDATVRSAPVLTISKQGSTDTATPGDLISWTVEVSNTGNANASAVTVSDLLPADTTFDSASNGGRFDPNTGTVSWNLGILQAGASEEFTLTARVNSPLANGTRLVNVASIDSDQTAPTEAVAEATVASLPDLRLDKVGTPDPVEAGAEIRWLITLENTGTDDASGVTLVDTLPSDTVFLAAAPGATESAGVVTWNVGTLAAGATQTFELTATVQSPLPNGTPLINNVEVASNEVPPLSAQQVSSVASRPVLSIEKSADRDLVEASDSFTYTIEYANTGNADAIDVVLIDPLPAGTSFVAASNGGTASADEVIWNLGVVEAGTMGQVTLTVTADAPASNGEVLVNTATISSVGTPPQVASTSTTISSGPVLRLGKSVTPGAVAAGDTVTYTLELENDGTDVARDTVVTDVLPGAFTFISADSGGRWDPATRTVSWDIGTLAAGDSRSLTLAVVPAGPIANGSILTNAASAEAQDHPLVTADASVSVSSAPELTLTKRSSPLSVLAGGVVTWTLEYANQGSDAALDLVLQDPLPPGATFVAASAGGVENAGVVTWSLGRLDPDASGAVTVDMLIDASAPSGPLGNSATLGASNASDVSAAAEVLVTDQARLELTKVTAFPTVPQGSEVSFVLTFTNVGNGTASNVRLSNPLPPNTTFVSASGGGSFDGSAINWSLGDLPAGGTGQVVITVRLDRGLAAMTAINSTGLLEADGVASATATASVSVGTAPLLELEKVAGGGPVLAGDSLEYSLSWSNGGSRAATGVVLTDTLPPGASFVSASDGGSYSPVTNTVSWNLGTVSAGASGSFTVALSTDPLAPEGAALVNRAALTSSELPVVEATSSTVVAARPILLMTKTTAQAQATPGDTIDYVITVTNSGSATATGLQITDRIPSGVTFLSSNGSYDASTETVTWAPDDLDPGASVTLTLQVEADAGLDEGTRIVNIAELIASNTSGGIAEAETLISATPELVLEKNVSVSSARRGTALSFTLSYRNDGAVTAVNPELSDRLPQGVEFVSATGGGSYDTSTRTVSWSLPDLDPGTSGDVMLTVRVGDSLNPGALIDNVASLTTDSGPSTTGQAGVIIEGVSEVRAIPTMNRLLLAAMALMLLAIAQRRYRVS